MIEKNKKTQEGMSDEELSEVSGGKTIDRYRFFDVASKSQKAEIVIEDGKLTSSWGLDKLNDRDKSQLSDSVKKKVGL